MAVNENDYGLIIGIDHYPGYRDLDGARNDAQAFAGWMTNTDTGGGVPQSNKRLLLSDPNPIRPIQDDIDDAIYELISLAGDGHGRRFYLYFSGHGLASRRLGADLCLGRWSKTFRNAALDSEDYYDLLVGSGNFSEIVCLLDCCRVRLSNARGMRSALGYPRPDDEAGKDRRFIGYATEYQNVAWEAITEQQSDQDARGYFTTALLEALNGGAAKSPAGVPASRLKSFLEQRTKELARLDDREQLPEITNGFHSDNEPIFGSALPNREVTVSFSEARLGHRVQVIDPDDETIFEDVATAEPWILNLSSGLFLLVDVSDNSEKSIREGMTDVNF